jgi:hypothetical protein
MTKIQKPGNNQEPNSNQKEFIMATPAIIENMYPFYATNNPIPDLIRNPEEQIPGYRLSPVWEKKESIAFLPVCKTGNLSSVWEIGQQGATFPITCSKNLFQGEAPV